MSVMTAVLEGLRDPAIASALAKDPKTGQPSVYRELAPGRADAYPYVTVSVTESPSITHIHKLEAEARIEIFSDRSAALVEELAELFRTRLHNRQLQDPQGEVGALRAWYTGRSEVFKPRNDMHTRSILTQYRIQAWMLDR